EPARREQQWFPWTSDDDRSRTGDTWAHGSASSGFRRATEFFYYTAGSERPVDRVLRRERARNLLSSDAGRSRSGLPRPPLRLRSGLRQNRISSAGSVLTLP